MVHFTVLKKLIQPRYVIFKIEAGIILSENTQMDKNIYTTIPKLSCYTCFFYVLNIYIICNNKFPPPYQL
jgi:hypothetical protein